MSEHHHDHPLRLHGILAQAGDPAFQNQLDQLAHVAKIEYLYIPVDEAGRKRFRRRTDRGRECSVSLDRHEDLTDGALLHIDASSAIVVQFAPQALWRLRPGTASAALKLGWNAGNLHWRVRFDDDGTLAILLDGPLEDYRARIAPLLADGGIDEIEDA